MALYIVEADENGLGMQMETLIHDRLIHLSQQSP
jgi:hypothetical protein